MKEIIKKICPKCLESSFSACSYGKWDCPVCGYDISGEPALALDEKEPSNVRELRRDRKHLRLVKT